MKISLSKYRQGQWMIGILFSFFLLGEQIRRGIYEPLSLNFWFLINLFLLLYVNRNNLKRNALILVTLMALHATIINIMNGCSINAILRCVVVYYCPLLLCTINYEKVELNYNYCAYKCIKWFNRFVILMFGIYIFDFFTQGMIMRFLGENLLYSVSSWMPHSYGLFSYRYPSFMGHFLYTGEIYLIFFALNSSYKKITNRWIMRPVYLYPIYVIGTLSTGSKTCTVLMIVLILLFNLWEKNGAVKGILVIGSMAFMYSIGLFEFVISRFGGDITTGRADAWNYLIAAGGFKLSLFSGYGMNLRANWQDLISSVVSNIYSVNSLSGILLEYPILCNFFRFGILNACMIVVFMFVLPVRRLLSQKCTYIAIVIVLLFLDVNTFNLLSEGMDAMIVYMWTILVLEFIGKSRTT